MEKNVISKVKKIFKDLCLVKENRNFLGSMQSNIYKIVLSMAVLLCTCGLYSGTAWAQEFTYTLSEGYNNTYGEYKINWDTKPGDTIVIKYGGGKKYRAATVENAANLTYTANVESYDRNRFMWYFRCTIPDDYRGGTLQILVPECSSYSESEGTQYYGNKRYYFTLPNTHTHTWGDWSVYGDTHYRPCTTCGEWLEYHNKWDRQHWVKEENQHYRYCDNCGITWGQEEHSFGDATNITATCTASGTQQKTCSECYYVKTEKISALGHVWPTSWEQGEPGTKYQGYYYKECTRCGDFLDKMAFTYYVTFDANGGDGYMDDQEFEYGTPQNLNPNTFTKEGYEFVGWDRSAGNADAAFADGQAVSNLCVYPRDYITLYAIWKLSTNTITFHDNGGYGGPGEQTWLIGSEQHPTSPFREGYNFAGWNTLTDGTGTAWPTDDIVPAGISDYYAQWISNTYTTVQEPNSTDGGNNTEIRTYRVFYNGNGSTSGSMNADTYISGETAILASNVYKKGDLTFLGWNTNANGSGTWYEEGASINSSIVGTGNTITLYAQWGDKNYSYHHTLYVQYEDVYGNFPDDKIEVDKISLLPGQTLTWSTDALNWTDEEQKEWQSAEVNYRTGAANKETCVKIYRKMYNLDLNGQLDGVDKTSIAGMGTITMVINGEVVGTKLNDYWGKWRYGSTYEIKDIVVNPGYEFVRCFDPVKINDGLTGKVLGQGSYINSLGVKQYITHIYMAFKKTTTN